MNFGFNKIGSRNVDNTITDTKNNNATRLNKLLADIIKSNTNKTAAK